MQEGLGTPSLPIPLGPHILGTIFGAVICMLKKRYLLKEKFSFGILPLRFCMLTPIPCLQRTSFVTRNFVDSTQDH